MKFLLVDDEPYVTTMVSTRLQRLGHETRVGMDGEEGVSIARVFVPDLVVTDLQMPRMSGMELAMRLFEDPRLRTIPVILLTGRGHLVEDTMLAQTNIVARLEKPFSVRDLIAQIEANLRFAA